MSALKLTRSDKNPILSPINTKEHWWEARSVFNPGAVVKDGKIYLLYRALGEVHYSTFGLAIFSDPTTLEKRFEKPVYEPDENNPYEEFGVEDARIVQLDGTYYIVYNAPSIYRYREKTVNAWDHMNVPWRLRCSLAQTDDFTTYKRLGVILPDIDSKDGVLFPEKINGQYVLLHRIFPNMWISFSDSITHFEKGTVLAKTRVGKWDSERIGAGPPPIKTELGWLLFYHGVRNSTSNDVPSFHDRGLNGKGGFQYSIGIMLLDQADPWKILYRSEEPILVPETEYEKKGYVNNVVFSCGAIDFKNMYYIYYGAADTKVAVASVDKKELMEYLKKTLLR